MNVAARLEGLAEPGGICVSRTVLDHVQGKVDYGLDDLGEQVVKNIPEPVRVFKVLLDAPAAEHTAVPAPTPKRTSRWPIVAGGPNNADSLAELAYYLVYAGNPDEAATFIRDAKRLNPNFPNWYHRPAGIAEYLAGRFEAATEEFSAWFENDVIPFHSALWLAATQAQTGNNSEAKAALQAALVGERKYTTTSAVASYIPFKNQEHLDSLIDGLRKAGMPDAG